MRQATSLPSAPRGRPLGKRTPLTIVGLIAVLVATFGLGTMLRAKTSTVPQARAPRPAVTTDAVIQSLQIKLTKNPTDSKAAVDLAAAYFQKVRETADPAWYPKVEAVLRDVLQREPANASALALMGGLQLSLHNFQAGLDWGLKARAADPISLAPYPVLIDGYVELGKYAQAVATADEYVALRPALSSYTRVAYLRELYGDRHGAIQAMNSALDAVTPGTEAAAWTRVQLGNLYFNGGQPDVALREYERTLQEIKDYPPALAGVARVAAARGDLAQAATLLTDVVNRLPLPEYVILLGDVYAASGNTTAASEQYALVGVITTLMAANGLNSDLELALFYADHPNLGVPPDEIVERARKAYTIRPSVYGHDVLAWALYRSGQYDEAQREITQALELGTRDAILYFHAGMIAKERGDLAGARRNLETALRINPNFSILFAPEARAALAELGD